MTNYQREVAIIRISTGKVLSRFRRVRLKDVEEFTYESAKMELKLSLMMNKGAGLEKKHPILFMSESLKIYVLGRSIKSVDENKKIEPEEKDVFKEIMYKKYIVNERLITSLILEECEKELDGKNISNEEYVKLFQKVEKRLQETVFEECLLISHGEKEIKRIIEAGFTD